MNTTIETNKSVEMTPETRRRIRNAIRELTDAAKWNESVELPVMSIITELRELMAQAS